MSLSYQLEHRQRLRNEQNEQVHERNTLSEHYTSSKARFRPGKQPAPIARTASLISLPSPPAEHDLDDDDVDMVQDDTEDEDAEVDQLESDTENAGRDSHGHDAPSRAHKHLRPCLLGSPANFLGAPAGAAVSASRRQLLNPFLPAAAASTSTSVQPFPGAPLSPSSSPVRPQRQNASPTRRRHRSDPDRIKLAAAAAGAAEAEAEAAGDATTTPPSRPHALEIDELEERRRTMGWYDDENPFVDRNDDMARRMQRKEPLERPETITWVKRGQRVQTTIPFSALLTSDSPSDDPFTFTAPKLLFPPQTPPSPTPADLPATPARQSKFLEALKAAGAGGPTGSAAQQLPPTPATLKRRAPTATAGQLADERAGPPAKRVRTSSAVGESHRGLR